MIALLAKAKSYLWIGMAVMALFAWGMWERSGKIKVQADYDTFIIKAQAIAAVQLAENQRKEKENAQRIKDAESDRDTALKQLRHTTANTSRLRTTIAALTASTTGKVCYRSQAFDAALSGITGLIIEGDGAIIDNRAWFDSWPR
jgi:hypothetical protein